jgi:hypothetical protein
MLPPFPLARCGFSKDCRFYHDIMSPDLPHALRDTFREKRLYDTFWFQPGDNFVAKLTVGFVIAR